MCLLTCTFYFFLIDPAVIAVVGPMKRLLLSMEIDDSSKVLHCKANAVPTSLARSFRRSFACHAMSKHPITNIVLSLFRTI